MPGGIANRWIVSSELGLMLLVCRPHRERTRRYCCGGFPLCSRVCRPRQSCAHAFLPPVKPMPRRPTSHWWMNCSAQRILASSSPATGWMQRATQTPTATNGMCPRRAPMNTATTSFARSMATWATTSSSASKSPVTYSRSRVWIPRYKSTRASSAPCFITSASTATAAVSMRTASIRKW